ncbi:DUF4062 domain-containing protein [Microbacterium deminutum]
MGRVAGVIRTPDQRLRVFVSSTLKELAPERRAVRAAIERLAMAPVMFELGARPHPPRELYRAYLEQSDIFVGIYWEQYGWIAPGEGVSGLEDEWNLAPGIPKLIYLKAGEHRDERLDGLLARIRDDDHASYVAFTDAAELTGLVTADLATLLAERFDAANLRRPALAAPEVDVASTQLIGLPSPRTTLRGREQDLARLTRLLTEGERLVTVTGPGGIGKSRLAVAAARAAETSFPDGIAFVDLTRVGEAGRAMGAVANALGIRDAGHSLDEAVRVSLRERRMLVLLDNVEHVVDAAPELCAALIDDSAASLLATSRIPLRVDGEAIMELGPLQPAAAEQVFVERAQAAKPDFQRTDANAEALTAIVAALDGVPLALELAAARLRVMTPGALVERLDHALPLLADGGRDLPERQRTIRATIEWSIRLLNDDARRLLLRLGVFPTGFALEAAVWMAQGDETTALDAVSALVEGSLIRERDHGQRTWYTMPVPIREYVRQQLEGRGELEEARDLHARFYVQLAGRAGRALVTPEQRLWMPRLVDERDELRAAIDYLLQSHRLDDAAELLWPLLWFWFMGGQLIEASVWGTTLLAAEGSLSPRSSAIATFYGHALASWQSFEPVRVLRPLARAVKTFRREGDRFGQALVLITLATARLTKRFPDYIGAVRDARKSYALMEQIGDPFGQNIAGTTLGFLALLRRDFAGARRRFEEVIVRCREIDDRLFEGIAHYHLGWIDVQTGNLGQAKYRFGEQLRVSTDIGAEEGLAFSLEGFFAIAAQEDDAERAGRFFGAAEVLRERKALFWNRRFAFHTKTLQEIRGGSDAALFEVGRLDGRNADLDDVVALAFSMVRGTQLAALT